MLERKSICPKSNTAAYQEYSSSKSGINLPQARPPLESKNKPYNYCTLTFHQIYFFS